MMIFSFYTPIYIIAHFLIWLLLLREYSIFSKENTIFNYHFCSFISISTLNTLLYSVHDEFSILHLAAVIGCHAIYSLSFLEAWSLTKDSYSLGILRLIVRKRGLPLDPVPASLMEIGTQKKATRMGSIEKLGLAQREKDLYSLTAKGRFVATLTTFFLWLVKIKKSG